MRPWKRKGIVQEFQRIAQVYDVDILAGIESFLKILRLQARGNQFLEGQLVAAFAAAARALLWSRLRDRPDKDGASA